MRIHRQIALDGTELEPIPYTDGEEAAADAAKAAATAFTASNKYKDVRREAYGDIGAQLDMLYWDQVNNTTTFKDHVAAVKAAHSKPE